MDFLVTVCARLQPTSIGYTCSSTSCLLGM